MLALVKRMHKVLGASALALMVSLYVAAGQAMAQAVSVFPVDQAGFDDVTATLLAWAAPVFAILIAFMAYKWVKRVVR